MRNYRVRYEGLKRCGFLWLRKEPRWAVDVWSVWGECPECWNCISKGHTQAEAEKEIKRHVWTVPCDH